MKNSPYITAAFGLLITILRIAMFVGVVDGGFGKVLSTVFAGAFAIFIAVGVYVSAYFSNYESTKWPARVGLAIFGAADLWFNEATVIYYTSSATLVAPDSNFMGIGSEFIRYAMQWTALGFGALPTIGAAVLAFVQSKAAQIQELNKPGLAYRIQLALSRIVTGFGLGLAEWLEKKGKDADSQGIKTPSNDGQIPARRWHTLTAAEIALVPLKSRAELQALFGISDGAAGDWKRWVAEGKRPRSLKG